ncbi:MAG: BrnT family toxin [Gemmatimonadaceae bacterium]
MVTPLRFEWDPAKAVANVRKHGVTFSEARTAFADDRARVRDDPDHSGAEDRFILLGLSAWLRLLVVVHVSLESDSVVRIISARRATPSERAQYGAQWKP